MTKHLKQLHAHLPRDMFAGTKACPYLVECHKGKGLREEAEGEVVVEAQRQRQLDDGLGGKGEHARENGRGTTADCLRGRGGRNPPGG